MWTISKKRYIFEAKIEIHLFSLPTQLIIRLKQMRGIFLSLVRDQQLRT